MNRSYVQTDPYTCPGCSKVQRQHEVRDTPMTKSWHCPGCHYRIKLESRFRRKG